MELLTKEIREAFKKIGSQDGKMEIKAYDIYRKSFPYYKCQYWDDRVMAWRDIQKRFNG